MSADLLVIVPSRERPQNIDALVGACAGAGMVAIVEWTRARRTTTVVRDEPMPVGV